jgi:putative oxidoreductase
MTASFSRLLASNAPAAVLLIRLLVGAVFVSEGIQKFLFPADLGVGRFTKIGLPSPEVLAPFVGVVEIVGGLLLLLGLLTRLAALALLVDMLVAITTTKIPILLKEGLWKMAHEARTDWSMLLGALFLLLVGAGAWSLDVLLTKAGTRTSTRERRYG